MRTLKILIIVMGVLIIIGFATVVVTLVRRLALPSGAPRESTVVLPPGSHIEGVYGGANAIILDLGAAGTDPRTGRRFLVVDPATGGIARTITVRNSGPSAPTP